MSSSLGRTTTLPVELLTMIVQNIHDGDDLHRLAQASRDLNFLAVEELCSKYNIHPRSGILTLDTHTLPIISTLAISLSIVGAPLQFLNCDLTNTQSPQEMIKQTSALLNFISALSSLQRASFYFPNSGPREWEDTLVAVFDALAEKSCADLHVKTLTRSTTSSGPRNNKLASLLQRFSLPATGKRQNSRVVKSYSNRLETCYLQTLPTFLQPLFLYRLNASSRLTTLTFRYIYNYQEWDSFLTHLDLPSLLVFTVSHCIIPGDAFSTFLKHHPSIVSLDFHHNTYLRHNPPALPSGILPRLTKLRTTSEYLVRYFPPLDTFPELTSVILPAGDMTRDSTKAVMALQALLPCVNDITLSLEFTYVQCLDTWLRDSLVRAHHHGQAANRFGDTDPTRFLRCVKALKLDSKLIAYSSDGVMDLLVRWLCMFPALNRVFITRPCLPRVFTRDHFQKFAKTLARGSACIKNISVEADDLSIWTSCLN